MHEIQGLGWGYNFGSQCMYGEGTTTIGCEWFHVVVAQRRIRPAKTKAGRGSSRHGSRHGSKSRGDTLRASRRCASGRGDGGALRSPLGT